MTTYTIYKSLHIIGLVLWMGGLFSLSSLIRFQNEQESEFRKKLTAYGRKIYYASNLVGLLLTIIFGLLLLLTNTSLVKGGWFHAKLFFVVALIVLDHIVLRQLKKIGEVKVSEGKIKLYHLLISLLFLFVVVLAVTKPF